jgi:hypothetical protein
MFKQVKLLFLYTETPLHVGSGSSLGTVDLPIQRFNLLVLKANFAVLLIATIIMMMKQKNNGERS